MAGGSRSARMSCMGGCGRWRMCCADGALARGIGWPSSRRIRWEWAGGGLCNPGGGWRGCAAVSDAAAGADWVYVADSGAKVAVVSSKELYEKVTQAGELPELRHVVVMDAGEFAGAESFAALMMGAKEKQGRDAEFDALTKTAKPEDLATLIYTSGTTGEPKGVMLTHGNLASNVNLSTGPLGFSEKDSCISFLPLSHVTARHLDYAMMCHGAKLAYCPKFDHLVHAMKAVKPTVFVAVPRGVREDPPGGGREVGSVGSEVEDSELGDWDGEETQGGDAGWEDSRGSELEAGE